MSGAVLLPNFGAEEGDESAAPKHGLEDAAQLWRLLFGPGTRFFDDRPVEPSAFGERAGPVFPWIEDGGGCVPWLSTERAARRIARAGLRLAGPDPQAVRTVHDKGFALRKAAELDLLPPVLAGAIRIFEPEELATPAAVRTAIAALPDWVDHWVLKPRLGSSGRGRVPGRGRELVPVVEAALPRLAQRGGAILEPWLSRTGDHSMLLHVGEEGPTLLGITEQVLTPSGVYFGNRGTVARRSGSRWDEELEEAALRLGAAIHAAGFRGPCGVDAFAFRDPAGVERLRPAVEVNARFTMGTVALGLVRRAEEAGLLEGARGFFFSLRRAAEAPAEARRIALGRGAELQLF